ncbi:MAG TPA: type VI secretion system contractile sheath small subunit [Serratia grimesii]|uniref:Type VI secretion system contractile sheath small subunit n=1 Tax=Serratia grimesii TaxID=82995 RepID=A0A9C7V5M3_9GAMM|nr:type VI secretion system contractile sheath small subunit [Serratia grimesii]HCJ98484.1 type VI secretion system contractile sheath small subunit [Serratia grimesii]
MAIKNNGQKFIGRNRGPRVQIEYDVDVQGDDKKVQLPFVNGVIADLSGDNRADLPVVADRSFLEIDVDNFDDRLRAISPYIDISVPNQLTGEGELALKLNIRQMDDFSPGAVARSVEPLCELLEARNRLANLMTYMDGKSGAEQLVADLLANGELMGSLSAKGAEPAVDKTPDEEEA